MKQIITVLAILISGIASAQDLWEVSVCDGEIVENGNNYVILPDLQQQITDDFTNNNGDNFFCLETGVLTINDPYNRYFTWYNFGIRSANTGDQYTGTAATIRNYSFARAPGVRIRVYPSNYADGNFFDLTPGIRRQRLGHGPTRTEYAGKFEVRTTRSGSSANIRRFTNAIEAFQWAYDN